MDLHRPCLVLCVVFLMACKTAPAKTPFVRYPNHKPSSNKPVHTETIKGGLVVEDLKFGQGASLKSGDFVTLHFSGWFKDDLTKFDSSIDRGAYLQYQYGIHPINQGWDLGIFGMRVGGKRRLIIPSAMAYGPDGRGPVPGGKDLIYEIDLLQIKR
jgi:FKBP-type peptidyl-prolyl cis-trans isomerase